MAEDPVKQSADDADPEPAGAIEIDVQGQKQKMVSVDVLAAERKRARESTEQRVRAEYEPLKEEVAKGKQRDADLAVLQPHIDYLRQHPELLKREEPPEQQQVSDEDAERFAKQYELYSATGLDLTRARRMIADNRKEIEKVARATAQEAIEPYAKTSAEQASRSNFIWAAGEAQKRGVDPAAVALVWKALPANLTQHPEVAQHVLQVAMGNAALTGKVGPTAPDLEPLLSEAAGGGRGAYRISDLEKKIANISGMSEKDFGDRAKQYQPDAVNILGD